MSRVTFSAVIILIAVQFSRNENIPILAFLLGLIIVSVLSYFVFSNKLDLEERKNNTAQNDLGISLGYKTILLVSLPLLLAQSGQFIMAWTDKLMLGGFMSATEVGVYDVAFKLSMFVNIALTSVNSISSPKFAEMYAKKDFKRLEKIVHQSTKIIFWTTVPLLVVFFSFSSQLLSLFGDEFASGMQVFMILCSARMVSAFSGPAGNLLQMTGRQVIFMKVLFIGAIINFGLNFILIPKFGIEGAAYASIFSIVFWNLTMVYFVKKEFGFLTIYIPFSIKNNDK